MERKVLKVKGDRETYKIVVRTCKGYAQRVRPEAMGGMYL
jgi:hypothetical protein